LRRYAGTTGGKREQVTFAMTYESVIKVVSDIAGA
jgi:hypothetical protein